MICVPPALPPTTTAAPTIQHFTVNFTITNLRYKAEMATPNSKVFNATARTMNVLVSVRAAVGVIQERRAIPDMTKGTHHDPGLGEPFLQGETETFMTFS